MNEEDYLQQIARTIVNTTTVFHRKGADVVVELHNSLLRITSLVGQEMERLRRIEEEKKND